MPNTFEGKQSWFVGRIKILTYRESFGSCFAHCFYYWPWVIEIKPKPTLQGLETAPVRCKKDKAVRYVLGCTQSNWPKRKSSAKYSHM